MKAMNKSNLENKNNFYPQNLDSQEDEYQSDN